MRASRRLARALAVAVVTLGLTPALQGHAWACSCVSDAAPPPIEQQYRAAAREAKLVYVGRVVSERRTSTPPDDAYHYTVAVTETLKGPHAAVRRPVTAANGGLCGKRLDVGKPVLVLTDEPRGGLFLCGLSTQEDVARYAAVIRAALREPSMPRTGAGGAAAWLAVATGVTAAVAVRHRRASGRHQG